MSNATTLDQLFDLAVAIEQANEALYHGLRSQFAHEPEVADFWAGYAGEEVGHAAWLRRLRERVRPEQLSAPTDPFMAEMARKLAAASVDDRLAGLGDLDQAYEMVYEYENSETNVIFEFLISHFADDEDTKSFLRALLREHITRLTTAFPAEFKSARRRQEVKAAG
jgi:rubrerythrin